MYFLSSGNRLLSSIDVDRMKTNLRACLLYTTGRPSRHDWQETSGGLYGILQLRQRGKSACKQGRYKGKYEEWQRQKVKGRSEVKKDDSNSSGKCSNENGDDNVNGDGDANSDGDKVIQTKNPTKRLVKKSKRKVEK